MIKLKRFLENPILLPSIKNDWEKKAAFNGCVAGENGKFHLVYRALSSPRHHSGFNMEVSSIGYAESVDGINFINNKQLIKPELEWEIYGCEDPRITRLGNKYFIFYTALSSYPFSADGIKVGLAITSDFKTLEEKHLVTPFNAKAMSIFPEKINGKIAAVLTANTDIPPSKACIAYFDKESDIWSREYWDKWYSSLSEHSVHLQKEGNDQVEVGAPPIKTEHGWLLIYSYIQNYLSGAAVFGIEAALLDLNNPQKILARTQEPLLTPEKDYEVYGNVANIVFPTGVVVHNGKLFVYYGAADTSVCLAACNYKDLLDDLLLQKNIRLQRFAKNPIISPIEDHPWESKATFNPAAVYEKGKVHVVYRAMSQDETSSFGYAVSSDGFSIDERLSSPIYIPTEDFEKKKKPGNSGCEDPRITKIDDRFYMCYTAFDGVGVPRVAFTSIKVQDFLNRQWNSWEKPKIISPPNVDDKDACILPKKIKGGYMIFHRIEPGIYVDFVSDLNFSNGKFLRGDMLIRPRKNKWDALKIGICPPPIETKKGWLLLYHGISKDFYYRVGAALLDLNNPLKVITRSEYPILKPEEVYEKEGQVPNVVFPCGAVVVDGELFVYYGAADSVVCVATIKIDKLLDGLTR
ncbi:MAG: hypothetical protein A2687_01930 [Candidatus Levybacteria bacterium RIFCSPHIGHO2_01_FULL_38_26]|nr:MAG: hypothetical protein A2687_01930 [Candidatus Levybacteria bacterium RIFCSPHIGHO2_01_FULL_38_26]